MSDRNARSSHSPCTGRTSCTPIPPKLHRLIERPCGIKYERGILVRPVPGEGKSHLVSGMNLELSLVAHLDALELDRGVENERIRPGNGDETAVRPPDPRNVVPIFEAHDQLGPHLHLAFNAPYDPDNSRMMMPGRHEVDDLYDTGAGGDLGLEHHRSTPIAAHVGGDRLVSGHLPAAVSCSLRAVWRNNSLSRSEEGKANRWNHLVRQARQSRYRRSSRSPR